jgi:hypothetical protein
MNNRIKRVNLVNNRFIQRNVFDIFHPLKTKDISLKNFDGEMTIYHYLDGTPISYYSKHNSLGYRCDEFIKDHKNKKHIVFTGCSETFGEGGPIDDSWSHILYKNLGGSDKFSGYFNLAIAGAGHVDILNVFLEYCKEYGNPDIAVMLLPNTRFAQFFNKLNFPQLPQDGYYRYSAFSIEDAEKIVKRDSSAIILNGFDAVNESTLFVGCQFIMKLIEDLCNKNNITLVWGTWDEQSKHQMSEYDQKNLFESMIDCAIENEDIYEEMLLDPTLTIKKPDGHFGTAQHNIWAKRFYDTLIKRGVNE